MLFIRICIMICNLVTHNYSFISIFENKLYTISISKNYKNIKYFKIHKILQNLHLFNVLSYFNFFSSLLKSI